MAYHKNQKRRGYKHQSTLGVPKGYQHSWKYNGRWNEKKIRKGLWKIRFRATKSRGGSKKLGSFGIGTKGAWKISGIQYIKKIGPRKYQTTLIGTKKPLKFYVKKPYKGRGKRY